MFGLSLTAFRVIACALVFALGVGFGAELVHLVDEADHAKQLAVAVAQASAEHQDYVEAVQQGERVASQLESDLRINSANVSDLKWRFANAHMPMFVQPASPAAPVADARLTLGAQRLYDDAASGADVPAGACGVAGAADAACAAPSAISVGTFQSVAVENAGRQYDCGRRLNALIDLLQQQGRAASPPAAP